MFYEGHRSVTPLDAARVNRTIFHNHYLVDDLKKLKPKSSPAGLLGFLFAV